MKKIPKFYEGEKLPTWYFDSVPLKFIPESDINLRKLGRYIRETNKDPFDMTKEEIAQFAV